MVYRFLFLVSMLIFFAPLFAQQKSEPLPLSIIKTMVDSTTSMDVVMLMGQAGSISAEGQNVQYFNSFIDAKTAAKTNAPIAGNMMWLINGREFISGNYYLGDSTGYVVFLKDGREYVNRFNAQGFAFFKIQSER